MVEGWFHVLLGDYIIHIFNDKIHMGRNVVRHLPLSGWYIQTVYLSDSDYIIHRCEGMIRYAMISCASDKLPR